MEVQSVEIALVGDVMIGRGVNEFISQNGSSYVWGDTLSAFEKMDVNIVNLETALTKSNNKRPKVFNFKAGPEKIQTLEFAHITVVNLANNHILDFSEEGLTETLSVLKAAGINYVGAGLNMEEAAKAGIAEKNNLRIGILGFTDNEPDWKASQLKSGTNYIDVSEMTDKKRILDQIRTLKKSGVDLIIVSAHWGYNMEEEPPQDFIEFAHEMINAGADILHGHSAHIFQGIEIYKSKVILYDTGDFIDDYVVDPFLRNDLSFIFKVLVEKGRIKSLKLMPVKIKNCQVNFAENIEYEWSIQRMKKLSEKFGTEITKVGEVILGT